MSKIDFGAFDCDNHYYEAHDAFTRHVPHEMKARCVQWAEIDGRRHHIVGGRLSRAVSNPTWNPIAKPGALCDFFRGNPEGATALEKLKDREPLPPAYIEPGARVDRMDEQGLDGLWLFPTLGVLYEELLKHDTEALKTTFRAFNRWLNEDWGLEYHNRIFAAPYISFCEVQFACEEVEWALNQGARVLVTRPAAAWTKDGPRSPADPVFDPLWARINEAGVTMVVHAGDSGYTTHGYARDGFSASFGASGGFRPSIRGFNIERAAYDFLITLAFEKLFERFPNLRVASVENGAQFLGDLFRKLEQSRDRMRWYYKEDPVALFKEHVWINPFWEDDVQEVAHYMGTDRVIFGSDWPHIEGMPQPLDYVAELSGFGQADRRKILRDNGAAMNQPRPG